MDTFLFQIVLNKTTALPVCTGKKNIEITIFSISDIICLTKNTSNDVSGFLYTCFCGNHLQQNILCQILIAGIMVGVNQFLERPPPLVPGSHPDTVDFAGDPDNRPISSLLSESAY